MKPSSCLSPTPTVSITDQYEFNFVRSLIYRNIDEPPSGSNNPIKPGAWMGLTVYKSTDGDMRYEWTDQFPLAATFWDYHEPNENNIPSEPNKACVAMNLPYGNWGVVSSCSQRLAYVCKTNTSMVPLCFEPHGLRFKTVRLRTVLAKQRKRNMEM